jgi:hypothetical protein
MRLDFISALINIKSNMIKFKGEMSGDDTSPPIEFY